MLNFNLTLDDRISRAKINVLRNSPFFSYLVEHLIFNKVNWGTCAVDNKRNFYYNPDFLKKLNEKEMSGTFLHEVLHLALGHPFRARGKNLWIGNVSLWNIATDIVVNNIIVMNGGEWAKVPKGAIIPQNNSIKIFEVKIENISEKSAEDIYYELAEKLKQKYGDPQVYNYNIGQGEDKENKQGNGEGKDKGENKEQGEQGEDKKKKKENSKGQEKKGEEKQRKVRGWQDVKGKEFDKHMWDKRDGKEEGNKEDAEKWENEWKRILAEAKEYAKQRGDIPAGMEREFKALNKPKVNWRAILRQTVRSQIPSDYTYSHNNRKYAWQDYFVPAVLREGIEVTVAIDTSGSISNEDLGDIITEIIEIARSFSSVKMRLITHDAEVHDDYEIRNGNIAKIKKLKIHGGGGTSHIPLYEYIRKKYPKTKLLISFTDGYSEFPENRKDIVPTIFVLGGVHVSPKEMPKWALKIIELERD